MGKKRLAALTLAAGMVFGGTMTAAAATAQDIIQMNQTSYTAGMNSVYGPSLTQDQLNQVAQAVADFTTNYINDSMDHDTKIRTAYDYLVDHVSYIDWNQGEGANAAFGALVRGQAACSGYARAFKALCDAMGVSCYYIHSTSNDHQWNMVEFNDGYYFVDVQANDSSGFDWIYHSSTHPYAYDTAQFPAIGSKSGQDTSGTAAAAEGWVQDAAGWWWRNADGTWPASQWKEVSGKWYYFESSGYMAADQWIDGTYYVGSDGAMLANTTTPDGYQVDASGAWVQDGGLDDGNAKRLRIWDDNAIMQIHYNEKGHPLYHKETTYTTDDTYVVDQGVVEFSILSSESNVNPEGHWISVEAFYPSRGINSYLGTGISEPFEYDKTYSLNVSGGSMSDEQWVQYCRENQLVIMISIQDTERPYDYEADLNGNWYNSRTSFVKYAAQSSRPTGQIEQ